DTRVARLPVPSIVAARLHVFQSAAGDYYAGYLAKPELHGASWPTIYGSLARLAKWDADGNLQWQVGRHAIHGGLGPNPGSTPPGQIHEPAGIIGEAHGTVILADRVETLAMAWTEDGLYAGSFFDRRADDGLPDTVYSWWRDGEGNEAITTSDNASGGRVFQADDGIVYWFTQGRNSSPVYRIRGWDGWQRESGTVKIADTPPHAQAEGEGLRAAYYNGSDLGGTPDAERIDTQIWHGIPRGEDGYNGVLNGFRQGPAYDWSDGVEPLDVNTNFAVRWTGEIEAPLTETFTFSIYTRGAVRLWIDGKQRIFAWNQMRERWETEPIELRAGERYTVQLDYHTIREHPVCSLNWESFSVDRERIPQRYLYPAGLDTIETPDPRPATARINAGSFDVQSGEITPRYAAGRLVDRIWGLRQRGFGKSGAYLGYRRIDFGDGVSRLRVRARGRPSGNAEYDVTLAFRLGSPDGRTIATFAMHDRSKGMPERTVSVGEDVAGVHDLYVVNSTGHPDHAHIVLLHSFEFER
ncbi:MAG: PA14 domain-containing protein, partial [Phycisphaeraceae bacterium]